jgi:RHS repeat-associated protein
MTDSVMGTWSYTYDDFNRLTSGTASAGVDDTLALSWTYDRYGNRWAQSASGSGNISAVQPNLTFDTNNNQVAGWSYDADGNLLNDERNSYTYDAEGRITELNGAKAYVYDAEGRRVAKYSGSSVTATYILDLAGNQVTEFNGSGTWMHSNVWAGAKLLATYEGPGESKPNTYHFHLTDWLGTQRMQTNVAGNAEEECYSFPFGDGLTCTGSDATEHHFTSKIRDTESGLDYFGARYLSSDLGRFMTPDWAAKPTDVPYAAFGDPQSLNLYAYVGNNPNTGIDLDGHYSTSQAAGPGLDSFCTEDEGCDPMGPGSSSNSSSGSSSTSPSGATTDSNQNSGSSTPGTPATPAPSNPDPNAPVAQQTNDTEVAQNNTSGQGSQQGGQQTSGKPTPTNQPVDPAPTGADGKPTPPPVPVPGCPTCKWVWSPDSGNDRGGRWVPDNFPKTPGGIPGASWDPGSRGGPGHWDVDHGNKTRTRYYPDGRPMPDDVAHPPGWRPIWQQILRNIPNVIS